MTKPNRFWHVALSGLVLLLCSEDAWAKSRARSSPRLRLPSVEQQILDQERERAEAAPVAPQEAPPAPPAVTYLFESLFAYENRGADPGGKSAESLYNASALTGFARLDEAFSVTGRLRFEPVAALEAGQGLLPPSTLYLEVLQLRWRHGAVDVFGGKIHPRFGWALHNLPGIYAGTAAADYEMRERLGAGTRLRLHQILGLPEALGRLSVQLEAFGADNSPLSYGAFHPRWLQSKAVTDPASGETSYNNIRRWSSSVEVGGAGNNGSLGSMVASLGADRIVIPGGQLGYTGALAWQKPGDDAASLGRPATEFGAVGTVFAKFPLPWDVTLEPVLELAKRDQAGGLEGLTVTWSTAAATLSRGGIGITYAALSRRENDTRSVSEATIRQNVLNLSVDFEELTGVKALKPISAFIDARQIRQSGNTVNGMAVGLQLSLSF
ncbi:MAG: hypothetical protein INF79_11325 [Roseomonas sp.]|nr:hypothetical protein [Roseomonas sp.]